MIAIIARNNIKLTLAAVRSALKQTTPVSVLVIDNNSSDDTWRSLSAYYPQVAQERCLVRVGLATAWNKALKYAWRSGQNGVLMLNNDVEIRPDTYHILSSIADKTRPFVTCVSVRDREMVGTAWDRDIEDLKAHARPHPDFSAFYITKHVTDKVGWFDQHFFPAYCEDNDYHVRMHRAGIKAVCVDLPFYHAGASTLKSGTILERSEIERGAARNRLLFKEKYGCFPGTPEYEMIFK